MSDDTEVQKELNRVRRNEQRARDKRVQFEQAIANIEKGIGFSSAKNLATVFDTSEKTIFCWAADDDNEFPKQTKISPNMSRWENKEIKAYRDKLLGEKLYG